jgi:hypothetical protein
MDEDMQIPEETDHVFQLQEESSPELEGLEE